MFYILTIAVLITSLISGVLSMAGGMILMGVFGFFLSVPAAMVLHGVAQTASNGSRVWLYRHHIRWTVLVPYSMGAAVVLGLFLMTAFVPDKGVVFLVIGLFPFVIFVLPGNIHLNIEQPVTAGICGLVVTLAQMLAGASGPVLDIFYLKSELNRHEILGTKAITQTLGHIIKLVYYALFLNITLQENGGPDALPWWIFPAVIAAALMGNNLGKLVVDRIDDSQFRAVGRYVIMLIGIVYIGKGIHDLLADADMFPF